MPQLLAWARSACKGMSQLSETHTLARTHTNETRAVAMILSTTHGIETIINKQSNLYMSVYAWWNWLLKREQSLLIPSNNLHVALIPLITLDKEGGKVWDHISSTVYIPLIVDIPHTKKHVCLAESVHSSERICSSVSRESGLNDSGP